MARINEIDRRVLRTLSGADKIKGLLAGQGLTLSTFAEKHGQWVQNVSYCIRGQRPLPEIRDKLASEVGLTRAQIDELIDFPAEVAS